LSSPSQWPAIVPIIAEERGFGDILLVTKPAGASSDCKHWARQRQIHRNTTEDCKDDLFQQHPFCSKGSVAGADIPTEAVAQVEATQELEQHQQPTGSITPEIVSTTFLDKLSMMKEDKCSKDSHGSVGLASLTVQTIPVAIGKSSFC
jgi:hypothetical protein